LIRFTQLPRTSPHHVNGAASRFCISTMPLDERRFLSSRPEDWQSRGVKPILHPLPQIRRAAPARPLAGEARCGRYSSRRAHDAEGRRTLPLLTHGDGWRRPERFELLLRGRWMICGSGHAVGQKNKKILRLRRFRPELLVLHGRAVQVCHGPARMRSLELHTQSCSVFEAGMTSWPRRGTRSLVAEDFSLMAAGRGRWWAARRWGGWLLQAVDESAWRHTEKK